MNSEREGAHPTIRAAQRLGGGRARVTIYGPHGKVTSVFDDARVWYVGGYSPTGQWIDLEDGGLVFHVEQHPPDDDAESGAVTGI